MKRKEVASVSLNITKGGQVKHFQVKLPHTTKGIIGVELGLNWKGEVDAEKNISFPVNDPLPDVTSKHALFFKRNALIGEVKLQSCERANIFYSGELKTDNNTGYGVFAQSATWKPKPFTQQVRAYRELVFASGESTVIQGIYKDQYGLLTGLPTNYTVKVYVWIETEPVINNK